MIYDIIKYNIKYMIYDIINKCYHHCNRQPLLLNISTPGCSNAPAPGHNNNKNNNNAPGHNNNSNNNNNNNLPQAMIKNQ